MGEHEVILHHYPLSLFAEKIRRILAYKRIRWRSVEQPMMMPKPELTPLTGGYRKIPVLQIGADVYCDTACIARRLEALRPEPACLPRDVAGAAALVEEWADHRFTSQVVPSVIVEMMPGLPPGILDDRAAMSPMLSHDALTAMAPHTMSQALLSFDLLERMLRGRPFLLGDAFSLADAACYHPLWFLRKSERFDAALATRPALAAWVERIDALGPGDFRPMSAREALAIAREAEPVDVGGHVGDTASGFTPGAPITIVPDDIGREEVHGTIARVTADEITIRRHEPALGEIAVHFPRSGYRLA